MKYFIYILLAVITFYSCEDLETNSPALQGSLDNQLYKAIDARAITLDDESFVIQGVTQNEALTLKIRILAEGTYTLGVDAFTTATFDDALGNFYTTEPNGNGQIIISDIDRNNQSVSGSFKFNAILQGIDTLTAQQGVFYQIPYDLGTVEEPDNFNNGTLTAKINGNNFIGFTLTTILSGTSIIIEASNAGKKIILTIPADSPIGSYAYDDPGFDASYSFNGVNEPATSGTFIIISNAVGERRLRGSFSFQTAFNSITSGQFNVRY